MQHELSKPWVNPYLKNQILMKYRLKDTSSNSKDLSEFERFQEQRANVERITALAKEAFFRQNPDQVNHSQQKIYDLVKKYLYFIEPWKLYLESVMQEKDNFLNWFFRKWSGFRSWLMNFRVSFLTVSCATKTSTVTRPFADTKRNTRRAVLTVATSQLIPRSLLQFN